MTGPVPDSPLSDAARLLVEAAQVEASAMGHDFVGLEHLLLVLLADPDLAAQATAERDRPLPSRNVLRERLARARAPRGLVELAGARLSPQARRLIESLEAEARGQGRMGLDRQRALGRLLSVSRGPLAQALTGPGPGTDAAPEAVAREAPTAPAASTPAAREERPPRPERSGGPGGGRDEKRKDRPDRKDRPERRERRGERGPRRDIGAVGAERRATLERPVPAPPPLPLRSRRPFPWRAVLLIAIPVAAVLQAMHANPLMVFVAACLAVMPLAGYMGEATEHLATRTGPALGGLLNATFGNAAELIIAIVALRQGLTELVKASITGSILGNLLLILGLSIIAGGTGRPLIRFNRTSAGASAGMLTLAVVGLVFPAMFHSIHPEAGALAELQLSEVVAVILALTYGCSLLFSLRTHKSLFSGEPHPTTGTVWSPGRALAVLGLATAGVIAMSEILVHATRQLTETMGFSELFLGLIVVPIIGNAAEHASAILVARKGKIDLALQIAVGSSTQVALLVAPLLVLAGVLLGQQMDLVFRPFEIAAVGLATVITAIITLDGESHWFEGVQLLGTYALVAAAAWVM